MSQASGPAGLPDLAPAERESPFERVADYVSAAMGRPTNIIIWLVLVIAWTAMGPYLAQHPFLPAWSVSTGWNFPLNLVTTVAELFIGFLVAAASNRSERNLDRTLAGIGAQEQRIGDVEDKLTASMAENTDLTRAVHDLTAEVHRLVSQLPHAEVLSATAADAKAARQSAESAFVAAQTLAAAAARQPGPGELAAAVATQTEAVRGLHQLITTAVTPAPAPAADPAAAGKARKT